MEPRWVHYLCLKDCYGGVGSRHFMSLKRALVALAREDVPCMFFTNGWVDSRLVKEE